MYANEWAYCLQCLIYQWMVASCSVLLFIVVPQRIAHCEALLFFKLEFYPKFPVCVDLYNPSTWGVDCCLVVAFPLGLNIATWCVCVCDLYAIHYVFLHIIQSQLNVFREGWAHHRMRTEGNQTPMQLWIMGLQRAEEESSAVEGLEVRIVYGYFMCKLCVSCEDTFMKFPHTPMILHTC